MPAGDLPPLHLEVVRGAPTDEEVAAVVLALLAVRDSPAPPAAPARRRDLAFGWDRR